MAKAMSTKKAAVKIAANAGAKSAKKAESIRIVEPRIREAVITIGQLSPLIVHNWSAEAKTKIRAKQAQEETGPRGKRDPEREYLSARYLNKRGQECILSRAVKKALVRAATFSDALKAHVQGAVFVIGELIPIDYDAVTMREDTVRLAGPGGSADLRYRPEYAGWSAKVPVHFDEGILSLEQVVNLFKRAGFSVGIGDWRVEKSGEFGRFDVLSIAAKPSRAKAA